MASTTTTTTNTSSNNHPVVHLWLRDEVKPFEQRTPLTPLDAQFLIQQHGYKISVERSLTRAFSDAEYEQVGCELVPSHSWVLPLLHGQQECTDTTATTNTTNNNNFYILGLKELPLPNTTVTSSNGMTIQVPQYLTSQRHIFFAHCYKRQSDWKETMSRFSTHPSSEILDLEFLNLDNGRRVAAFGYAAGFNGMAMGLITYCKQILSNYSLEELNQQVQPFKNRNELIQYIKNLLSQIDHIPKVLVLGALGRCGSGSVKCAELCGIPSSHLIQWDLKETSRGGPFNELSTDIDILVNDIYLSGKIEPFLTMEMVQRSDRRLSVLVDVSCDVTNPYNPFPINSQVTTFDAPVRRVVEMACSSSSSSSCSSEFTTKPLDVIAIDHLPTMTPQESSEEFSNALVRYLAELKNVNFESITPLETSLSNTDATTTTTTTTTEGVRVWLRAHELFLKKLEEYQHEKVEM
ncbi:hypothetical protein FDP41_000392 [Naegleria fowleri]|uniref:Saccharopine dehydrogenase [NAD(+), L-lysine-forming] n=1 Tax=Naegleria fowleri TaxID=5763 RepID=A0A6A5C245_NAEFO|nr:uncharacterized protein FDP41_000392 [Naegleria fowleri]KAF0984493.1 hypothetical protein FDP41_000392 [Naegleria fowleri]